MLKINNDPDFSVFDVGTDKIVLKHYSVVAELLPFECYIKQDGSTDDKATLCFVCATAYPDMPKFIFQISKKMLQPVLDRLKELD